MSTPLPVLREGTRTDRDDFFCHKYEVWYRVEDCLYRTSNRTFAGCVGCFQGHLNRKCLERGSRPPAILGSGPSSQDSSSPSADGEDVATVTSLHDR